MLKARETLILTFTEIGPVYSVEPGGREIPLDEAQAIIGRKDVAPAGDTLFDVPPQTWRKIPRRRKP